ncbi:MAG: CoA pyrophosphatase [bacterium]|nr:CoA pyrophosphatase [Gemmatimonadota bacterium]HIL89549.1 CoA pyrophosphatase [Gemmatimonadota bacterium]
MIFSHTQETDSRFKALAKTLSLCSSKENISPVMPGAQFQAAVSVVLRSAEGLDLLLIKRAYFDRDPWSGHMALPGGRRDPKDIDLKHTAIRETMEETALELDQGAQHLGQLKALKPTSVRLPKLTITPFVFGVGRHTQAAVASPEINQVFWVSLDELRGRDSNSYVEIPMPDGRKQDFSCYMVEEEPVWGLTYRIISELLELCPP